MAMKYIFAMVLGLMACSCALAQSVAPLGTDRFAGQVPAMPTSDQIQKEPAPGMARPTFTTPRMASPAEIVHEVPAALRKAPATAVRMPQPSELVHEDAPVQQLPPNFQEEKR
jgi:hypothetical protein